MAPTALQLTNTFFVLEASWLGRKRREVAGSAAADPCCSSKATRPVFESNTDNAPSPAPTAT